LDSFGGHNYLYAANFMTGNVDVFDTAFKLAPLSFVDPALPAGYAPFNIKAIGSWLFVNYAERTPGSIDEMHGPGLGIVDVFSPDGTFVRRFASHGSLNAPWGIAWAPAGWLSKEDMDTTGGKGMGSDMDHADHGHDVSTAAVLIGNFGDGHINVYAPDGSFLGQLRSHNKVIAIDGLWALSFPPATSSIDQNRLYFTAGPADEADGEFGYLIKQ
ncbi:MAG TPA: TIGR03118 family protein, partial [Puia sp.]|nr:TIGR03118 family protein [Puia sp.]